MSAQTNKQNPEPTSEGYSIIPSAVWLFLGKLKIMTRKVVDRQQKDDAQLKLGEPVS